jgi:IrrE N-terminal-like domain
MFATPNTSRKFDIPNQYDPIVNSDQLSLLEQSRLADPAADDRVHMQRLAEAIVRDLAAQPPIDLGMVASYQGIASVEVLPLTCGGCLVTDPRTGAVSIKLNAHDHSRRRRFSGFHEIAHTFLPGYRLKTQWRCDPADLKPSARDLEALCDAGAAEMMLPRALVERDLPHLGFGLGGVEALAETYDASLNCAAARMTELWAEPALLVVLERRTKPTEAGQLDAEPKLRVAYSRSQGEWPFIKRHKSVGESDPLQRALAGEVIDERAALTTISSQTVADTHLSARLYPYTDSKGRTHERVLAMYRRTGHRSTSSS